MSDSPDIVILMTDEERAAPSYESETVAAWRRKALTSTNWFHDNAVSFERHYTGSLACVPSRPTLFTGQYPDVHGVTQTDGLGKMANDSRMRWLPAGEVPTLGNWFEAAGYDTHYDGKWHITHADLIDPATGRPVPTNTADGTVLPDGVQRYLEADRLAPYGFHGWVGPEPHGGALADSGLRRDPLLADRTVAWLTDRYARRAAGDPAALRPFLLVVSFVNPHDIVLFPIWQRRNPMGASPLDPPDIAESPTDHEDLRSKPAAQIAFRTSYYSGYGPPPAVERIYRNGAQAYRNLYYRLHAEVDASIDRVRRAVTDGGSTNAVIVRTSDHGELLGAHGGLHQKWFNLYDEATRIPMFIARIGDQPTAPRVITTPTSHVDLVPTLLAAAGIREDEVGEQLATSFSEVHPLPGSSLLDAVAGADADCDRAIYLLTRDNMLEGDSGASGLARRLKRDANPPMPLRIQVAAHVGANFEGLVATVPAGQVALGAGHLWKLVRTFDDPATWTTPGVQQLAANGIGGPVVRREPLPDEWELYDLDADPHEADNRAHQPSYLDVLEYLRTRLKEERHRCVPERNQPWPYVASKATTAALRHPPPPARALRKLVQRIGMHPDLSAAERFDGDLTGHRALIVCTNHGVLDVGKATGVFASELTVPYYAFLDAGMHVEVASPKGGIVPIDPMSLKPVIRSTADDRLLADPVLRDKITHSLAIGAVNTADYDIVFLAGGWGAAFDFATSTELADAMTSAAAADVVIGGICHGPLGLLNATAPDGRPLVEGRAVSAVTDKQVRELGINATPYHPERELRQAGAKFEAATRFRDPFANHWVADGNLVTGQNQNAGPMVADAMMRLVQARKGATEQ